MSRPRRPKEFKWRRAAERHRDKARADKPQNVEELRKMLHKIQTVGPLLRETPYRVQKLATITTDDGKQTFATVHIDRLVGILQWNRYCLILLAIIDLDRLAGRKREHYCYIVDGERDVDGNHLPLDIFIDQANHIRCHIVVDWDNGKIQTTIGEWESGSSNALH